MATESIADLAVEPTLPRSGGTRDRRAAHVTITAVAPKTATISAEQMITEVEDWRVRWLS